MHELLLFGNVPAERHEHLLKILAGVAGMLPQRVVERHLTFKPSRSPGKAASIGASQGVQQKQMQALQSMSHSELYYVKLIGVLQSPEELDLQDEKNGDRRTLWSLFFADLPEVAGKRPATSRMIVSFNLDTHDPFELMKTFGYEFFSEQVVDGHRLIHNNVIILLHRKLEHPEETKPSTPQREFPTLMSMKAVDHNTYTVETSIKVQDGNSPEAMTIGTNELKAFRDTIRSVIDLEVCDRLALDTRVK